MLIASLEEHNCFPEERDLFPLRMGEMEFTNPTFSAGAEYKVYVYVTRPLVDYILAQSYEYADNIEQRKRQLSVCKALVNGLHETE